MGREKDKQTQKKAGIKNRVRSRTAVSDGERQVWRWGREKKGDALLPENFGNFRPFLYADPVTCDSRLFRHCGAVAVAHAFPLLADAVAGYSRSCRLAEDLLRVLLCVDLQGHTAASFIRSTSTKEEPGCALATGTTRHMTHSSSTQCLTGRRTTGASGSKTCQAPIAHSRSIVPHPSQSRPEIATKHLTNPCGGGVTCYGIRRY